MLRAHTLLILLATASSTLALGFNDTFNDPPFTGSFSSLNGQQSWTTNDPFNVTDDAGDTSFVGFAAGFTSGSSGAGDQSALFGGTFASSGFFPDQPVPNLNKSFTPFGSGDVTLTIRFSIVESLDASFPEEDTFSFTLFDGSNNELLTLRMNPDNATVSDLRAEWYDDGTLQTTGGNPAVTQNREFVYRSIHNIQVVLSGNTFDAFISDFATANAAETNKQQFVDDGTISNGLTAADFANIQINWELADTTLTNNRYEDAGSNYIIMDDVSVVPEPGSAVLILLAAFVGLLARRRSQRTF